MRQRFDLLAISLLLFVVVLTAWLGIAGAIFSDIRMKGVYDFLKDWQTLIGVIGAFIVAYIAVLPVWRQVEESARQAAASAITPLTKTAENLERERRSAFEARKAMVYRVPHLVDEYDNGNYEDFYQRWPEDANSIRDDLDRFHHQFQKHLDRHPTGREIDRLRLETVKSLKKLRNDLDTMTHAFAQQTGGLSPELGEEELSADVVGTIGEKVINSLENFERSTEQLERALGEEIPRVWRRIRELEASALG